MNETGLAQKFVDPRCPDDYLRKAVITPGICRNQNLEYISRELETLGFHTFLSPPHVARVYFEFLVRCPNDLAISVDMLIEALTAEGCEVNYPRYPLLHQQPLFTEGLFSEIGAFAGRRDLELPKYLPDALPKTEQGNRTLIKLPNFPFADTSLLQQYVFGFQKVMGNAKRIADQQKRSDAKTA